MIFGHEHASSSGDIYTEQDSLPPLSSWQAS